jgi:hypothetical protein
LYVLGYSASVFGNSANMLITILDLSGHSNGYWATVAIIYNNNLEGTLVRSIDIWSTLMMGEKKGCYLEQWCLYIHQLKSGFSRVNFGPLFIHDS